MAALGSLSGAELISTADALSLPADAYGNDPNLEMMWAMKAYQHAEIYFNKHLNPGTCNNHSCPCSTHVSEIATTLRSQLICSVDPRFLKLTKEDDQIYAEFREQFSDMKVDIVDQEELKSDAAKLRWRPFCLQFEALVEDFNYGTLLRLDCSKDYVEDNTIFATRIQFFAVEIARNREGHNTALYERSAKGKTVSIDVASTKHEEAGGYFTREESTAHT